MTAWGRCLLGAFALAGAGVLAAAAPCGVSGRLGAQAGLLVWDGSSLQPLFSAYGITCDHWAIWVFGDGASATPGRQWGEHDGASADAVEEKWKAAVAFEAKWKRFAGVESDPTGEQNHLGPICVVKPLGIHAAVPDAGPLGLLAGRIASDLTFAQRLIRAYEKYVAAPGYHGYYTDPKSELQQYLDALKDTEQRVNSLRTRLVARNRATLAEIQGEIAGFSRGLDTVEANGTQLASRLHVNADTSWSGRAGTFPSGTAVVTSVVTLAGDGSALTVHNYFATNGQGRSFEVPFANLSGATPAPGLPTVVVLQLKTPGPCVTDQGEACPAASSYWVAFAAPADAAAFLKFVQDEIGGQ